MIKDVKSNRLHARRWLAALALGCVSLTATAQQGEIPFNGSRNSVEYRAAGNSYTWQPVTGPTPKPAQPYRPDLSGGTVSDTAPKATYTPKLPYEHKGGDMRAKFEVPINPKDVASQASKAAKSAAGGAAAGGAYGAVAGLACAFICEPLIGALADWGVDQFKKGEDGEIYVPVNDPDTTTGTSDGNEYRVRSAGTGWFFTRAAACQASSSYFQSKQPNMTVVSISVEKENCLVRHRYSNGSTTNFTYPTETMVSPCTAGSPVVNGQCNGQPSYIDKPLADFIDSKYGDSGWNRHFAAVAAGIIAAGGNVFTDGTGGPNPGSITGPSAVPQGTTTETTPTNVIPGTTTPAPSGYTGPTDPGTTTKTTTRTTNNTYDGNRQNTSTSTTINTTITNNINNNSNTTITTIVSDEPPPEEKEKPDFCETNPDALACTELDTPEGEIPEDTLNITYEYADIFGNGACPSDSYLNTGGQTLKVWDWQASCDAINSYFRPVLLACCAFAAFVIISAGVKS